ncbi:MAG: hypothetical protein ACI945_001794 [Pseudohongiellaceae bacterium]|jgi:hypothetical protein
MPIGSRAKLTTGLQILGLLLSILVKALLTTAFGALLKLLVIAYSELTPHVMVFG